MDKFPWIFQLQSCPISIDFFVKSTSHRKWKPNGNHSSCEVIYEVFYILNCGSWNHLSYERNLSNCVKKPEKSQRFESVTSRYRCDTLTNWAMKPLTLGAGHLWVLMSPWGMNSKWYMKCFIYWTADSKSSKLRSSQLWTQFKQLHIEAWKVRTSTPLKSWLKS